MPRPFTLVLAFFLAALLAGCARRSPEPPAARSPACETGAFLDANRDRHRAAIARARRWLDDLEVDPIELRARGLKGKKKLVELLGAYYRLHALAGEGDRPALVRRIESLVSITRESAYHDMLLVDDTTFKQDATSYLRAAVLMERLGLDTRLYRQEIRKAKARLDDHMKTRGPHQRRSFHWYYAHFGLEEPFPLGDALAGGVIARRLDPQRITSGQAYAFTHEIFSPYEYGDRLDAEPFTREERLYIREVLAALLPRWVSRRDPDLVAELVSCARYLRLVDMPEYARGLEYLLASQNENGSWGDLARARARLGALGDHGIILHTTVVAVDALTAAFHEPWNRELYAGCGAGAAR